REHSRILDHTFCHADELYAARRRAASATGRCDACGEQRSGGRVGRGALSGAALAVTLWASACSGQTATVTIDPTMTRGSDAAPVTILEFSDFQCPYCKRAQDTLEQVMREFP